jgi:iron complex transport system ATP-binding protein
MELSGQNLCCERGGRQVFAGLNFSVKSGSMLILRGPNGAGKSTLIKAVAGLLPITSGDIKFSGQSFAEINRRQMAKKMAYLPQGHDIHWPMSVENLVMLGRLPHLTRWRKPSEKDWQVVRQALRDCDVEGFRRRPVNTLSGGEKARVLLARALAVQPALLLVDEPLAGLDPGHQLEIIGFLRQLAQSGMAVVIVMHDLSLAVRFCHRIVLLGERQILNQGRTEEVMTVDNIARCFNIKALTGCITKIPFVLPVESLNDPSA